MPRSRRTSYLPTKTSANPPTASRSPKMTCLGSTSQRRKSVPAAPDAAELSAPALHTEGGSVKCDKRHNHSL